VAEVGNIYARASGPKFGLARCGRRRLSATIERATERDRREQNADDARALPFSRPAAQVETIRNALVRSKITIARHPHGQWARWSAPPNAGAPPSLAGLDRQFDGGERNPWRARWARAFSRSAAAGLPGRPSA
jgi:hypothetical protein